MAAARRPSVIEGEIEKLRQTSDRVLDKQGIFPARAAFEREVEDTQKKLRREFRGQLKQDVTEAVRKRAQKILDVQTQALGDNIGDAISRTTAQTTREALHAVTDFLHAMDKKASAIDDPVVSTRILREATKDAKAVRAAALPDIIAGMQIALAGAMRARAAKEVTVADFIEAVEVVFEAQWWKIERLVRTESSYAYNSTIARAIAEVAKESKGLFARWTEKVVETTQLPMDNAVADDSRIMHGQVSPGAEPRFTMRKREGILFAPRALAGKSWMHPPNRPNDRAVLTPWRKAWKVPGWIVQAGRKVPL